MIVVTGGTRSGKSGVAERLLAGRADVAYLATGAVVDDEMRDRVAVHAARRPATWTTVEVGDDLPSALLGAGDRAVLLDGLGAWMATVLHMEGAFADPARASDAGARRIADGVAALVGFGGEAVVVVEQAGWSPVAADAVTRRWVDELGTATQRLSAVAERVLLVVAGRVLDLHEAPCAR